MYIDIIKTDHVYRWTDTINIFIHNKHISIAFLCKQYLQYHSQGHRQKDYLHY